MVPQRIWKVATRKLLFDKCKTFQSEAQSWSEPALRVGFTVLFFFFFLLGKRRFTCETWISSANSKRFNSVCVLVERAFSFLDLSSFQELNGCFMTELRPSRWFSSLFFLSFWVVVYCSRVWMVRQRPANVPCATPQSLKMHISVLQIWPAQQSDK